MRVSAPTPPPDLPPAPFSPRRGCFCLSPTHNPTHKDKKPPAPRGPLCALWRPAVCPLCVLAGSGVGVPCGRLGGCLLLVGWCRCLGVLAAVRGSAIAACGAPRPSESSVSVAVSSRPRPARAIKNCPVFPRLGVLAFRCGAVGLRRYVCLPALGAPPRVAASSPCGVAGAATGPLRASRRPPRGVLRWRALWRAVCRRTLPVVASRGVVGLGGALANAGVPPPLWASCRSARPAPAPAAASLVAFSVLPRAFSACAALGPPRCFCLAFGVVWVFLWCCSGVAPVLLQSRWLSPQKSLDVALPPHASL